MGAKLHAQKAQQERVSIEAVFNNDIVGGAVGGTRSWTRRFVFIQKGLRIPPARWPDSSSAGRAVCAVARCA